MRNLWFVISLAGLSGLLSVSADNNSSFDYELALSFERDELDNLSLGNDPDLDRLEEEDYEFEFDLEYTINDSWYLFFGASLVDESETVKPNGSRESRSGLERKEMGVGVYFGEEIDSELKAGRVEIVSASEWWIWWDEDIDSIILNSVYGDFETLLGAAEEQARESTDADFIDPEVDGVRRIIASVSWEFTGEQSLNFYYLDQADNSDAYTIGEFEDTDEIDEEDADLAWVGISYLGGFEFDSVGEFGLELHAAQVRGDETLYEFDDPDPVSDRAEVVEQEKGRVSGSAESFLLSWRPEPLDNWLFSVGKTRGSADRDPDDNRDESYRQTGLQGDSEVFGQLFQPEISNLVVQAIGVVWEISEAVQIELTGFDYEQVEAADDIRDASLETDPLGLSRDLGSEIDLVLTIEAYDGLELILVAAEFEAGRAYGDSEGETSRYVSIELNYEF